MSVKRKDAAKASRRRAESEEPPGRPKVIFFDVGGTLLTAFPSVGRVYAEVAARWGIDVDPESAERLMRRAFARRRASEPAEGAAPHTLSLESARAWWRPIVRESLGAAADAPEFEKLFLDVFDEFGRPERYTLFPEVASTLDRLARAGHRLGAISNWDARLNGVLEGLGLVGVLDPIVISWEVGAEKPDRRIFDAARERAGVNGAATPLHVGDSLEDDVRGAQAAGFEARLIDRKAGETLETVMADLLVR